MLENHALPRKPKVTALFNDGVHSFQLSVGATVAELAERIGVLSRWHTSPPLAVRVQLNKQFRIH